MSNKNKSLMIEHDKCVGNINVMPVPSFQFSGLMDGIGISGLEDPMQSSAPTTHSSEITENTDIQ